MAPNWTEKGSFMPNIVGIFLLSCMLNIFSIHDNKKMPTIFGMNEPFSVQFGAMLKSLRQERRISQQKLAEAAGVERNYIYYLENAHCQGRCQ